MGGIAPALPSVATAPLQRVPTAQVQRVPAPQTAPPTNNNLPTAQVNPIVIPARANQPLQLPPKTRNRHKYIQLSPAEINKIAKPKFKCVGMQFIDDEDPSDVATGVVTSIVRHKKSKKLTFKYWNHQILDQEPTNPSDFEYIDLNYAVSNCKWSKYRPTATVFATALLAEETYLNRGLTRNSVKRARQRKNKRETLSQLNHANTALLSSQYNYTDFHALTALDLNADGTRLTYCICHT